MPRNNSHLPDSLKKGKCPMGFAAQTKVLGLVENSMRPNFIHGIFCCEALLIVLQLVS